MSVSEALQRWEEFPVTREPRPIVRSSMEHAMYEDMRTDPTFRALLDGPTVPSGDLPAELRERALWYCRDVDTDEEQPLAPLVRADAPFSTDRGIQWLPAWLMYPDNRRDPFVALDPGFARQWTWSPPDGYRGGENEVSRLDRDGVTLDYRFKGTPAAYADYPSATVYETATAVLVEPVEHDLDPDGVRLEFIEDREVRVRLAEPLGNRVLVGRDGGARTVLTGADAIRRPSWRLRRRRT